MKDLFEQIVDRLERKEHLLLATIVSSSGSSPLPSGEMMLIGSGGEELAGSVGGGLLEALVIEEAKKCLQEETPARIGSFDLNGDVSNEGMICGGSVDVLLEAILQADVGIFRKILDTRNEGSDCLLVRTLGKSVPIRKVVLSSKLEPLPESILTLAKSNTSLPDILRRSFGQTEVRRVQIDGGEMIVQPIRGIQNLVIFGGGHVSKYLAQIAAIAGFSITIVDDREEFADAARFPGATLVLSSQFDKAFGRIDIKPSTFIVIVTRGHHFDEKVLELALRTPAKYIGMIGSKRKVMSCFDELHRHGVSLTDLRRVHAPIGLDIGAVTAEEIAVSIAAELIRIHRGFHGSSMPLVDSIQSWFEKK